MGIEDFYGNVYQWLDGIYSDNFTLCTDYRNSQMINDGHDFQFVAPKDNVSYFGYIDKIMGYNTNGFTKNYNNDSNGTSSTYFADYGRVGSGCFGDCGGYWNDGSPAGAFCLDLSYDASYASSDLGTRLMYKHLASSGGGSVTEGYKLTLKDFDGSTIAEYDNVTNVSDAINFDTSTLNKKTDYYDLTFGGFGDENGNPIQELSNDTILYAHYINNGINPIIHDGDNIITLLIIADEEIEAGDISETTT